MSGGREEQLQLGRQFFQQQEELAGGLDLQVQQLLHNQAEAEDLDLAGTSILQGMQEVDVLIVVFLGLAVLAEVHFSEVAQGLFQELVQLWREVLMAAEQLVVLLQQAQLKLPELLELLEWS
jgi:hypothetical protein